MLSPQVARALWQLYAGAEHIGGRGQPRKGTSDAKVLEHARKRNQTVVTNNHDMIVLAAEQSTSVIWLHGRRRELPKAEMVIVCFRGVEEWARLLDEASGPVCLRAYKTKTVVMSMDKAAELAKARMRKSKQSQARKPAQKARLPGLFTDPGDD